MPPLVVFTTADSLRDAEAYLGEKPARAVRVELDMLQKAVARLDRENLLAEPEATPIRDSARPFVVAIGNGNSEVRTRYLKPDRAEAAFRALRLSLGGPESMTTFDQFGAPYGWK